ncbi:MAG: hypothetical protein IT303_14895 [Dehalococcoidia bacterium]|nr:hypothetical protein [Dehalococcoidia bacterium]
MSHHLHPTVARAAAFMSAYPAPWAICGGWAIDAWLGRQSRDHLDVDITIFAGDQLALFAHLRDWHMVPHDAVTPESREPWDGRELVLPAHIHARPPGEENRALLASWVTPPHTNARDGLDFDIVLNTREGATWLLREGPRVALPWPEAVCELAPGIPVATPEVLLFYKATAYHGLPDYPRPHDRADFDALLPHIPPDRRAWLHTAIATATPAHPWLPALA